MSDTPTEQPEYSKRGDGFPGDTAWNQVHDRFRSALAKLARDADPDARSEAGRISHQATYLLAALTCEVTKAQRKADQERQAMERETARLARQVRRMGRAGRPVPPSLLEILDTPERGRDA